MTEINWYNNNNDNNSTEHVITWSVAFAISESILFKRQHYLALRMLSALSATTGVELIVRLKPFSIPVNAEPCG